MASDLERYRGWLNLLREFTLEDFRPSLADQAKENLDLIEKNIEQDTDIVKALVTRAYPGSKPEDRRWTARRVLSLKGRRFVSESEKVGAQVAHWWACKDVLFSLAKGLHGAIVMLQNLLADLEELSSSQSPNQLTLRRKRAERDWAVTMVRGLATNGWVVAEEYRVELDRTRRQLDPSYTYQEFVWRSDIHPPMWFDAARELMLLSGMGILCAAPLIRAGVEREIWESVNPREGSKFKDFTVLKKEKTTRNDILKAFTTAFVIPTDVINGLYDWASRVLHRSKGLGLYEMWYAWDIAAEVGDLSPKTEAQKTEMADRAIQSLLDRGKIVLRPKQGLPS